MLEEPLLSLAEIVSLERCHLLGAPTLGHAARAFGSRWRHHLRDEETAIRYAFLCWLRHVEPAWETGLDERTPIADRILDEFGVSRLGAENRFVLGWLATRAPGALGDEERWKQDAESLFREAAEQAPHSRLFGCWRWFAGDLEDQRLVRHHRRALRVEISARYGGRGALGTFFVRNLSRSVDAASRRPRLV